MTYLQLYLQNFLLEMLVLFPLMVGVVGWKKLLGGVFLANALTHPWVFFFWTALPQVPLLPALFMGEFFAFALEALLYQRFLRIPWGLAMVGALAANLISWQFGPVLSYGLAKLGWIF